MRAGALMADAGHGPRLIVCQCCGRKKGRDGKRACDTCQTAGCQHNYDVYWRRGETCPAVERARRGGRRFRATRTLRKWWPR
jgi:hypothetical protein